MDARTDHTRRRWDRMAAYCEHSEHFQSPAMRRTREILCAGARGETLEVAVGTGRNLAYYPPQVRLTAVDVSPRMLDRARERAEELGRTVRFVEGDAQELDFPDRAFDTVLCTLAMCSVPDQLRALTEMYRVLTPGGRLLMVDHIEYARMPGRLVERRRENPRRLPREVAVEAGFEVGHHDRLFLGLVERVVAHRP
ncbi:class I SAM-dependent methyltransferase [Nocardiopsis alborubida]|uniref:Methyltransferase domain-containing protein n=1 Tax=Nocardiopsis alborubida TaxID=146802 RepID=A0A7X6RNR6_9ACTN|nr:class I SAM-dependent methyltransferase [Nocardiopsis alborubida]NKY96818.1 methyltransferase domain-containing protein [Nocardiopsis alborubida]